MAKNQSFLYSWKNFDEVMKFNFHKYLDEGKLSDVTLSVEGKFIKAHKIILSAASLYFEEMFSLYNDRPLIVLTELKYADVMSILEFIYKGSTEVKAENSERFMRTGRTLKIKGITTEVDEFTEYHEMTPPVFHSTPAPGKETNAQKSRQTELPVFKPRKMTVEKGNAADTVPKPFSIKIEKLSQEEPKAKPGPASKTGKRKTDSGKIFASTLIMCMLTRSYLTPQNQH